MQNTTTSVSKYATKNRDYAKLDLTPEQVARAKEKIQKVMNKDKEYPNFICEVKRGDTNKSREYTIKDITLPINRNIIERYHVYDNGKFYFHNWKTFLKYKFEPTLA